MKAAIYLRTSTKEQSNYSIEAQEEELKNYAAKHNIEIFKTYTDTSSGLTIEREALLNLLDDAEAEYFNVVLITETDRLARDIELIGYIKITLAQKSIKVNAINEAEQQDSDIEHLTKTILGAVAKFEVLRKNRRTARGREIAKRKNKFMSRPPLAYNMKEGKLIINKKGADKVRLIYERKTKGSSVYRIAKDLNMNEKTVSNILRNKFYCDPTLHGEHEAIIDTKTYKIANS